MWKERYKQDLTTLKKQIRKERLIHTEGVAYTAAALAMAHGADMDDAFLAGLLHDCGKGVPEDERIPFCERAGIPVTETERANTELLHAKIGAWYAKTWYFVKDREVLDAIAWHTTGHPGMGLLEKILFVADYIEPNRDRQPDLVEIRALAFRDLDRCVCRIAGDTVRYLEASGRKAVDPMTRATYEYYRDLTEGEERNGK